MSVILGKFRIMATKQSVRGGWSGVATGVQRSRVPRVYIIELVWLSGWTLPFCSIFFTIFILDDFHMAKQQSFLGNGYVPQGSVPRKLFFSWDKCLELSPKVVLPQEM
jgi:hypothetical protein